jgi:two-component system CheB/CheR fusion protein
VEQQSSPVVGVGASAGGLEALEQLFEALSPDSGMSFVVVQHLSADFESQLVELLGRRTALRVREARDGVAPEPDTVYLAMSDGDVVLEEGRLRFRAPEAGLRFPIDRFLRSLAHDAGEDAIAVILSGTGTDGSRGVQDVHRAGGLVLVQDPACARFDGMPRSAIASGAVDAVRTPRELAEALAAYVASPDRRLPDLESHGARRALPHLLELLRCRFGVDFDLYKPGTLARRLERRVELSGADDLEAFVRGIADDPERLKHTYRDLLIGVTRFFRDPEVFERLRADVLPRLVAEARASGRLRLWVAGCATGEEAYGLAMLLHDTLREQQVALDAKIFATDVFRPSLETAGAGVYSAPSVEEVPEPLRQRYFRPHEEDFRVVPELRRMIVFAHHDVLRDAPFTRIDLLSCRNLLIYLRAAAQERVLSRFHFALRTGGLLLLGPSETVGSLEGELEPVDAAQKLFRKARDVRLPLDLAFEERGEGRRLEPTSASSPPRDGGVRAAYDALLETYVPTGLLMDEWRELVHVFGDANRYLHAPSGRITHDVLSMVEGELRIAIGSALHRAARRGEPCELPVVRALATDGREDLVRLRMEPVEQARGGRRFFLATLEPVGGEREAEADAPERPDAQPSAGRPDLVRELAYTREHLRATIEELEASNEELQVTNEELVSSNQELQSTNEELHSVNEELYTVNAEHQRQIQELTQLTDDMDNLLRSTDIGTIFLDAELRIRRFTPAAARVLDPLPQDVGRPIAHLALHIELEPQILLELAQRVLETGAVVEREVRTHDGQELLLRIHPYRSSASGAVDGAVLTFVDLTRVKHADAAVRSARRRLEGVLEAAPDGILLVGRDGEIRLVNSAAERIFGYARDALIGMTVEQLLPESLRAAHVAHRRRFLDRPTARPMGLGRRLAARRRDGTELPVEIALGPVEADEEMLVVATVRDVTERVAVERRLETKERELRRAQRLEAVGALAGGIAHEFNNLLQRIGAHAEFVQEHLEGGSDPRDDLREVLRATERAAELTRQLLSFGRRRRQQRRVMDLLELVERLAGILVPVLGEAIELKVERPAAPVRAKIDPEELEQALVNLALNARDAMPHGGRLTIAVGVREVPEGEELPPGPYAVLTTRDTGRGIPPELVERVFEPFFTTKEVGKGTGLGLPMVYGFAQQSGGDVRLRSEPGAGTTVSIRLPLATEAARAHASADGGAPRPARARRSGRGARILLAEDDETVRRGSARILRRGGFEVLAAKTGEQALSLFTAEREAIDLVILDVVMPGLSGRDVYERIRALDPDKPVLFCTGYDQSTEALNFLEKERLPVVEKPFRSQELLAAIDRLLVGPGTGLEPPPPQVRG